MSRIAYGLAALVFLVDQLVKYWIIHIVELQAPYSVSVAGTRWGNLSRPFAVMSRLGHLSSAQLLPAVIFMSRRPGTSADFMIDKSFNDKYEMAIPHAFQCVICWGCKM